ncbi:MAG: hypothetical protein K9H61_05050 [Bacteroidia bacterium]|nr:hypothetical protein [Bacteroidia bacterium]MCF8426085.1 hypothetical protein [Bacteroidia bacterium]MCF8446346.1 hypothetical protein [Bacteroidia bacterium]
MKTKANSPQAINNKIAEDVKKEISFLVDGKDKTEFILPEKNHLNKGLFIYCPLRKITSNGKYSKDGEIGNVKQFYIDYSIMLKLNALFNDFKIPTNLHKDLIVAFLSMTFASTTNLSNDISMKEQIKGSKEFMELMEFLEGLTDNSLKIVEVKIRYKDTIKEKNSNTKLSSENFKSLSIGGNIGLNSVKDALLKYKAMEDYGILIKTYGVYKKRGFPNLIGKSKNHEKYNQEYLASVIFDYLRNSLFKPLFQLNQLDDNKKFQTELKKYKGMYPRDKMYLFISKLMILSGLIHLEAESDHTQQIDLIKKKLEKKLKDERDYVDLTNKLNSEPENNAYIATQFNWNF